MATATTLSPRALFQTLDARPEGLAQTQNALQLLLRRLRGSLDSATTSRGTSSSDDGPDGVWESAAPATPSEPLSIPHGNDAELFTETRDELVHWLMQRERQQLPLALWLLCMEIGACVLAVGGVSAASSDKLQLLLKNTSAPIKFPSSSAHCNTKQQIAFSCNVWDAVVASALPVINPLSAQASEKKSSVLSQLVGVFTHWMKAVMRGYEVAFISNAGAALIAHIVHSMATGKQTHLVSQAALDVLKQATTAPKLQANAPEIAITVMVLHATVANLSSPGSTESERELEKLHHLIVSSLKSDPFPHVHDPHSIVAMALGVSSVSTIKTSTAVSRQQASWPRVLMQQFALLRSVNLPLMSFRLGTTDNQRQEPVFQAFQNNLSAVMRANLDPGMVALSFQMLEKCAVEATAFFRRSVSPSYATLMKALQSVYPAGLLRENVTTYTDAKITEAVEDTAVILGYLKALYLAVSSTLQVLTVNQSGNVNALLLAFLTLSKLEFARESCASSETNAYMNSLTQQIEDAIELGSPTLVLSTVLRSVLAAEKSSLNKNDVGALTAWPPAPAPTSSPTLSQSSLNNAPGTDNVIPLDVDVIYCAQALVVGVILQRKLRVLLFQSSALMDDALALVFSGLYCGYEPLNLFAHNFLSFCLTHLGQYISIYNIAPHYLQVTLKKYPANVEQGTLAKTCGVIFGALFYAGSAVAEGRNSNSTLIAINQQQRMVLWAMKQCCDRVAELVLGPKADGDDDANLKSGVYLAGIVFEVMKMGPIDLLVLNAMEIELLLSKCTTAVVAKEYKTVLHALKTQLFTSISQNCDAEKRAWLAAWYVELANVYPTDQEKEQEKEGNDKEAATAAQSRL